MGWMEGLPRCFIGSCDSPMERAGVSGLWSWLHPRPQMPPGLLFPSLCCFCCTPASVSQAGILHKARVTSSQLNPRKEGALHLFHLENNFRGGLWLVCPVTCLLRNQAGGDGVMASFLKSYVAAVGAKIVPKRWGVIIRGGEMESNKAGVTHCRFFPPLWVWGADAESSTTWSEVW